MRTNNLTVLSYIIRLLGAFKRFPAQLLAVVGVPLTTVGWLYMHLGLLHRDISARSILVANGLSFRRRRNS
jgi:hypothetical protein